MLGSAIRRRKRTSYSIQSGGWSRGPFASRVGPAMRILPKAAAIVGLPLTTFLGLGIGSTHSLADFPVSPPQPDQPTAKPTKPPPPPDKTKMRTAAG